MDAKKAMVPCVMVLVVLVSLLAWPTGARDPFVGLSIGGPRTRASGTLECCNNCSCDDGWTCTCKDRSRIGKGCTAGCCDCRYNIRQFPPFYCADQLDYCPDKCGTN